MNLAVGTACGKVWKCLLLCWEGTRGAGNVGHTLRQVSGEEGRCLQYFKRGQSAMRAASFSKSGGCGGTRGLRPEA